MPFTNFNQQGHLVITQYVMTRGPAPSATTGDGFMTAGMVRYFAGDYAPAGDARAQGQIITIAGNESLFAAIGTTYGGDGVTTFALPNLGGRVSVGVGQGTGLTNYTLGQTFGSDDLDITSQNLPTTAGGQGVAFDNRQESMATNYLILVDGYPVNDQSLLSPGEIVQYAGTVIPDGYLPCDGRLLLISEQPALFNIIGTTFGGDGQTTFALPDLRGRVPLGVDQHNPLGSRSGSETVTLTTNQLPTDMGGNGDGVPMSQPALALNYIINIAGVFPPFDGSGNNGSETNLRYLGEIVLFAGSTPPNGWEFARGANPVDPAKPGAVLDHQHVVWRKWSDDLRTS